MTAAASGDGVGRGVAPVKVEEAVAVVVAVGEVEAVAVEEAPAVAVDRGNVIVRGGDRGVVGCAVEVSRHLQGAIHGASRTRAG